MGRGQLVILMPGVYVAQQAARLSRCWVQRRGWCRASVPSWRLRSATAASRTTWPDPGAPTAWCTHMIRCPSSWAGQQAVAGQGLQGQLGMHTMYGARGAGGVEIRSQGSSWRPQHAVWVDDLMLWLKLGAIPRAAAHPGLHCKDAVCKHTSSWVPLLGQRPLGLICSS